LGVGEDGEDGEMREMGVLWFFSIALYYESSEKAPRRQDGLGKGRFGGDRMISETVQHKACPYSIDRSGLGGLI
jgi:hypothetical protein